MPRNKGLLTLTIVSIAVALVLPLLVSSYIAHVAVLSFIFLFPALGYNIIYGYTGMLSLAQGAFFGIGGYASALVTLKLGFPFWLGFICGGLVASFVALALAPPALRLRDTSFVMVTLGILVFCRILARNWEGLTRGALGLIGIPRPHVGVWGTSGPVLSTPGSMYYLALGLGLTGILIFYGIVRSPAGRILVGIRDEEIAVQGYGINVWLYRASAFVIAGGFAGLGGSLYVHYLSVITPEVFELLITITIITIVIGGGAGTVGGVLLGTLVFIFVPEALRLTPELRLIIYGIFLLVLVFALPGGLNVLVKRLFARMDRR